MAGSESEWDLNSELDSMSELESDSASDDKLNQNMMANISHSTVKCSQSNSESKAAVGSGPELELHAATG